MVTVNGARIYYESRGRGPAVLFISGATGDAGHWSLVAPLLSDEFTVVTYDRRGNSRSPRPVGWTATSIDEHADDAAGLIEALGLAPATVFGTSDGARILLELIGRRPDLLRGAIVHEPPLTEILPNGHEVNHAFQSTVEQAMAKGGPRAAMELFLRWVVGDATFEHTDPELRERLLGNAEVFFGLELQAFDSYVPDPRKLATTRIPIVVAAGAENRSRELVEGRFLYDASAWLAKRVGTELIEFPGAHVPYMDRPQAFVDALRPLLRKLRQAA
jgi:pimeloyl-ACP methyl ester carboxylesterase